MRREPFRRAADARLKPSRYAVVENALAEDVTHRLLLPLGGCLLLLLLRSTLGLLRAALLLLRHPTLLLTGYPTLRRTNSSLAPDSSKCARVKGAVLWRADLALRPRPRSEAPTPSRSCA